MERISYIPFDKIKKIEIYINSKKLTLSQIVKQTGCDYAVTGNFYNSSWKATCPLKKDGTVLVNSSYVCRGFRWNTPNDFGQCRIPTEADGYDNYYTCCTLIANGSAYPNNLVIYNKDVGGTRGRTGIGIKGKNLVLYASKDGTSDAKTPEKLRDYLFAKGITEFIMGDGGGKVNFYGDGTMMQGISKSQNLILVYLKKGNETTTQPTPESKQEETTITTDTGFTIQPAFLTNNLRYKKQEKKTKTGYMQHSTGTPGAKASAFIKTWNSTSASAETEFIIDDTGIYQMMPIGIRTWHCGGTGNSTHVGCEVCEPLNARLLDVNWKNLSQGSSNNTTYAVKLLQQELQSWGYNPNGIDGIFGAGTKSAVLAFQKKQGLTADGIVGLGTLHALQKRKGSYLLYNTVENQAYFENVYRKAVFTCAYVLRQMGQKTIDKNTVLSHAEGHSMGIASAHADVGHWWPQHGKSMNDFREDVTKYMNTGVLPYSDINTSTETSDNDKTTDAQGELELAWDKACDMGLFDGTNPTGTVTRRQLAVVLYRLNLLK